MKNSIAYLSTDKPEDLSFLVNEVLKRLSQTEYIILYGSYARDNYIRRRIRVEDDGIPTVKISDYDILILTSGINGKKTETVLDNVEDIFFTGKDFLSFTLRNNKQHNLFKLSGSTKRYSEDLKTVFPQDMPEEKRLFTLLKVAYVDACYNLHFVVMKEDIDELIPKVELLRDITERICEERIKGYEKLQFSENKYS